MRSVSVVVAIAVATLVSACKEEKEAPKPAPSASVATPEKAPAPSIALPASPPVPATPNGLSDVPAPADNATTPDKVALGWELFFDKRLSKDDSMACESCHHTDKAWTSGKALDDKVGGKNKRNAPSMENLAYHREFYWDGRMPTLEAVSNAAWKGQLGADPAAVAEKLNAIPDYKARFQRAFQQNATPDNVPKALAAFLRALKSGDSPFDRFLKGDKSAMSEDAQRGWKLFGSAGCVTCHLPPLFSDTQYHNVGIGAGKPEAEQDKGRMDATKDEKDFGKFKTPSLRDVAKTAPYFHDGSVATLDEAIKIMSEGGPKEAKGNPHLDPQLKPHPMSDKERADLKAFLEALTGTATFHGPPPAIP